MTLKDRIRKIMANNRKEMRFCAMSYRRAQRLGNLSLMVKWLILAATFRKLNQGYAEELT